MVSVEKACKLVLQKSSEKYISAVTEYDENYEIGISYEDGDVPDGFCYCVNKSTGEVGTVGSYEMFEEYNGIIIPHSVPDEFRCPNYKYYDQDSFD